MTSNGFGILLIHVERIKMDMAQTWEGLQRTTGRIVKNEWINMITKEKNLKEPPLELKMKVAKAQFTRKNWKTNEDTCCNLDT